MGNMLDVYIVRRIDSEGRDVTDMPSLWSEDDTERRLNPFLVCRKCGSGEYHSKPTARWMNSWKCDFCGHAVSK